MKVFVAGATGAIGRPLVSALVAAKHEVIGMTSKEAGLYKLREAGADGVILSALDSEAVRTALAKIRPDAVIDELTSLPKRYTPEEMRAAAPRDRQLRIEGGSNLQRAATDAGAKRYIVQSTGFFYGAGPDLATEEDSLAIKAPAGIASSVRTYVEIEKRVLGRPGTEGVALRYGFFCGPGTYHDPSDGSISQQVREQKYPIIGEGQGVYSFVHVDGAASATVAALEAEPGVYNVVDDNPSPVSVWLPAFALWIGAPPPPNISEDTARQTAGDDAVYYAKSLRGASNAKAKHVLGFQPRPLEWLMSASAQRSRQAG